jgi:hypothetical protein
VGQEPLFKNRVICEQKAPKLLDGTYRGGAPENMLEKEVESLIKKGWIGAKCFFF